MGVVTTRHIKAGEELFTHYGYHPDRDIFFPGDFPWYWKLKEKIEKEEREENNKYITNNDANCESGASENLSCGTSPWP